MFDLKTLHGRAFLMEPGAIRRAIARAATFTNCPSPRELVASRKLWLEDGKQAAATALRSSKGKVGLIHILGPVDQRVTGEMEKVGGTPLEYVSAAFDALMADSSVSAIVFDIDSPGGNSYGVMELADKIHAARGTKPSYAVANSMAASAGYWLASAASHFSVTPGGDVGSVGVYCVHVDESAALTMEGFNVTAISAGDYKTEFASWAPLSADAKAALQESVNATYSKFVSGVARNRGTTVSEVKKNYGQGRVMNAEQALAAGMVDRIATLDEVLAKLTGRPAGASGNKSSAMLRLRHELAKRKAVVS